MRTVVIGPNHSRAKYQLAPLRRYPANIRHNRVTLDLLLAKGIDVDSILVMEPHRLIILGAGFSAPAGLPLNNGLMPLLLTEFGQLPDGARFRAERDVNRFCEYSALRFGNRVSPESINVEEFISFLDLEHYLGLKGSDTLSAEGNETQIYVRFLIARLLHDYQAKITSKSWDLYIDFVKRLRPGDLVLTFNYDTILETACNRANVAYRLCPHRYQEVFRSGGGILRSNEGEVVICKLHGSIDWFSRERFDRQRALFLKNSLNPTPQHVVFENEDIFDVEPLADKPYPTSDPFFHIYRVRNLDQLFSDRSRVSPTPVLIAPSHSKIVYLNPLLGFWYDFNSMGISKSQLIVIGFSFPNQDDYAMASVVQAIANFQHNNDTTDWAESTKLKIVDFQPTDDAQDRFRSTKPFIDWDKTKCYWGGLSRDIVDEVVEQPVFLRQLSAEVSDFSAVQETAADYETLFPAKRMSGDMRGACALNWDSEQGIDQFARECGVDLACWLPVAVRVSRSVSGSQVSILAASSNDYNQLNADFINMLAHQNDGVAYVHELLLCNTPAKVLDQFGRIEGLLVRTDMGAIEELRRIDSATLST